MVRFGTRCPTESGRKQVYVSEYIVLIFKQATNQEINKAFRQMSKIFHPDKHLDPAKKKQAEIFFNKIKNAHESKETKCLLCRGLKFSENLVYMNISNGQIHSCT